MSLALIETRKAHRDAGAGEFVSGVAYRRAQEAGLHQIGANDSQVHVGVAIAALRPLATGPQGNELAGLHYAYFLRLRGANREATTVLEGIAAAARDSWIGYMAEFLLGRAALADQRSNAAAFLRQALKLRPGTPSASRALAAHLYLTGDRNAALTVLATTNPSVDDPWIWFPFGDYYLWPERLARLRALTW